MVLFAAPVLQTRAADVPGTYTTTWLGNSLASGSDHIPQNITGLSVGADGTTFTNVFWDEGSYESTQFDADGAVVGAARNMHGWGYHGGMAVAANAKYVFIGGTVDNEGGRMLKGFTTNAGAADASTTWPPAGKDWYGFTRRYRVKIQKGAPSKEGKGGLGDTIKGSFKVVNETPLKSPANLTGLAASEMRVYAADPKNGKIRIYDAETLEEQPTVALPRVFRLTLDAGGALWAIQRAGEGQPAKVLKFDAAGAIQPGQITFAATSDPVAIAAGPNDQIVIADNGPDQNLKFYNAASIGTANPTAPAKTFGTSLMAGPAGQQGKVGPGRFLGLTGVGLDSGGNLYVSSNYVGPPTGDTKNEAGQAGILEKYSPAGERLWIKYGLQFVDNAAIDPGSDGDIYSDYEHYKFDWSKTSPGSEWSLAGVTINRYAFPQDMRVKAFNRQPVMKRLNGKPYLFASEQNARGIYIYRFDPETQGESAIPAGQITKGPDNVPNAPRGTEFIWRDANGNGQFDAGEFVTPPAPRDLGDACWGWCVDDAGDIWQTVNGNGTAGGLRHFKLQGFDKFSNPTYGYAPGQLETTPVPAPFLNKANDGLERVIYNKATDVMYLAGYTQPAQNSTWGAFRVIARYNDWSKGNRTAAWSKAVDAELAPKQTPIALAMAGDYIFVGGVQSKCKVVAYRASDGTYVGDFIPNNGQFAVAQTGWVDVRPFGVNAFKRANGEYVLLVEEDLNCKTVVYRWLPPTPTGK